MMEDLAPSCLGCGNLVNSDCICGVCEGNLHCWCSILHGEGHGSHYLCAICADEPPDVSTAPSTEQNNQPDLSRTPERRKAFGGANPLQSTSRRAKTSAASSHLCKGKQICTKCSKLYLILENIEQRACLNNNAPNSTMYYGTVVGGSSQKGWEVK